MLRVLAAPRYPAGLPSGSQDPVPARLLGLEQEELTHEGTCNYTQQQAGLLEGKGGDRSHQERKMVLTHFALIVVLIWPSL